MKMYINGLVIILLLLNMSFAEEDGSVANVATTAASFLEIGVGAKAIGMGGAAVAVVNDVSAMYWNPAGIARSKRPEIMLLHTEWIADVQFDFAGFIVPLGRVGTIGASITTLAMDEMKVRTVDRPEGTGEFFNASDLALQVSYGFNITDRFSLGFNAKYIQQKIWKESARGFALDIGTLFTTGLNGMRIGAALTNFGSDMQMRGEDLLVYHDVDPGQMGNNDRIFSDLRTDKWPLPLNFQVGVAMEAFENRIHRITMAVDAMHPIDNTESIHLGMEYAMKEQFFLRAGYRNLFQEDSEEGLTFGAGFVTRFINNFQVSLDYAYAEFGRLENAQRFSLKLGF